MKKLKNYLDCGNYSQPEGYNHGEFLVTRFSDIFEKIIPFFDSYSIQGVKCKDFEDFKKVALLIEKGAHLTREGLEEIKKIKVRMNSFR
jgi:hypothetical protein